MGTFDIGLYCCSSLDCVLLLGEVKYSPSVEPAWKAGSARFLDFYKALENEPDPGVRIGLCKVARSRVREQGGDRA